jgi:hypothetical protein
MSVVGGKNDVGANSISVERNRERTFRNIGESLHRALDLLLQGAAPILVLI